MKTKEEPNEQHRSRSHPTWLMFSHLTVPKTSRMPSYRNHHRHLSYDQNAKHFRHSLISISNRRDTMLVTNLSKDMSGGALSQHHGDDESRPRQTKRVIAASGLIHEKIAQDSELGRSCNSTIFQT